MELMNGNVLSPARFHEKLIASFLLLLSFALLYGGVLAKLVNDWRIDDNYSHGFLIVPLSCYFVWKRRQALQAALPRRSIVGLFIVLGSLAVLTAGMLGAELFLTRVSMLGVIAGGVLYILGWNHLRLVALPIAFLLLMIPIPVILFNQVAFPLQLVASKFGESALQALDIPVLREGNIINLANTSLEVAQACSGIRSLISLLTLGIVYGYFMDSRIWLRVVLALATAPVAVFANGIRVAGTGVAAHYYGAEAAQGFFHAFSGWFVFLMAFAALLVLHQLVSQLVKLVGRR